MRRFTHLIDGVDNIDMTWDRWYKNVSVSRIWTSISRRADFLGPAAFRLFPSALCSPLPSSSATSHT